MFYISVYVLFIQKYNNNNNIFLCLLSFLDIYAQHKQFAFGSTLKEEKENQDNTKNQKKKKKLKKKTTLSNDKSKVSICSAYFLKLVVGVCKSLTT